jgi:hypothetical protein
MSYEAFEKAIVLGHKVELEDGKIIKGNPDLANGKANQKYNKFINDVQAVKAHEYLVTDFKKIGRKDVIDMSIHIIILLFGEQAVPEAIEFFKRLIPAQTRSMACLDGVALSIVNRETGEKQEMTQVPDVETSSSVVAIVHEFVHYYIGKMNIDMTKKRYYHEILSIMAEKIAHLVIQQNTKEPSFSQKIEESRLEALGYHYSTQLPALEERIKEHGELKRRAAKGDFMAAMILAKMESEIPLIDTPANIAILRDYYRSQAESYGIGYLFGDYLAKRFLDDHDTFQKQIAALQGHDKTIQDLLDYYGINLKNYEVYNSVNDTLQLVKQKRM